MSKFNLLLLLIICSPVFGHGDYLTCAQEKFNYLSQHNAAKSSLRSINSNKIEIADDGQIFYCTNVKPKIIDCNNGHCSARCGLNRPLHFNFPHRKKYASFLVSNHSSNLYTEKLK